MYIYIAHDIFSRAAFLLEKPIQDVDRVRALERLAESFRLYGYERLESIAVNRCKSSFADRISCAVNDLARIVTKFGEHEDVRLASMEVLRAITAINRQAYDVVFNKVKEMKYASFDSPKIAIAVSMYFDVLEGREIPDEPFHPRMCATNMQFAYTC